MGSSGSGSGSGSGVSSGSSGVAEEDLLGFGRLVGLGRGTH